MIRLNMILLTILIPVILLAESNTKNTQITIYNTNLGLVYQTKNMTMEKGLNDISIEGISTRVDPTSVLLSFPQKKDKIQILEQNYLYDLVNSQKIFQKYIGEKIIYHLIDGSGYSGEILSIDGTNIILKKSDGGIRITSIKQISDYNFPELPEGLILKPTLQWQINSDFKGNTETQLSYLTSGMSWHAEYVLVLDKNEKDFYLSSWISLDNKSGATYKNAKVKLVAGDIHRKNRPRNGIEYAPAFAKQTMADAGNFQERGIMDYHLYELNRPVTLKNREIKQVSLFDETSCKGDKKYIFSNRSYSEVEKSLEVQFSFPNTQNNNLEIPLPKGVVRVFKKDIDETLQLVGEDNINHIAKKDTVKLTLGNAFDVKGKRTIVHVQKFKRSEEITVKITLTNRKTEKAPVVVKEIHRDDWYIQNASEKYYKMSSSLLEFRVELGPDEVKTIEYKYTRKW